MEILFTHYPLGSINFFRKVIRFGFLGGILMALPAIYVLAITWSAPTFCDRVLRIYHLLRLLIFLIQVPLRLIMSRQLQHASRGHDRASVVDRLIALCHSWAWRLNQATGVIVYWMFAFALVFTWSAQHCSDRSSALYRLCVINVIIFFIHMLLSLNWLRLIVQEDSFEAAMWKRGASHEMIEMYTTKLIFGEKQVEQNTNDDNTSTTLVHRTSSSSESSESSESSSSSSSSETNSKEHNSDTNQTSTSIDQESTTTGLPFHQTECSICMCDYHVGQSIRVLPCSHNYHQSCIDEWLYKKKACPLCSREIDHNSTSTSHSTSSSTSTIRPVRAIPPHLHPHQS